MDPGAADAPGAPPPEPESADPTPPQEHPSSSSPPPPPAEHQTASTPPQPQPSSSSQPPSRYESQKRRDWNTFLQYLKNHKPPLTLARCSGAHVIEFLKYLDQFGKTKVHTPSCPHFGRPNPPAPCTCPLKQAWGSLDALIGRLRAAYEESGGKPESNPFGTKAVRIYLREVRESQAKARGIPYDKKKRKRSVAAGAGGSTAAAVTVSVSTTTVVETTTGGEEEGAGDEKERGDPTPTTDTTTDTTDPPAAASSSS